MHRIDRLPTYVVLTLVSYKTRDGSALSVCLQGVLAWGILAPDGWPGRLHRTRAPESHRRIVEPRAILSALLAELARMHLFLAGSL
jgi:hypothetical protein